MGEISQKQLEANRQNAKLGGVKTEEGKEIIKYNALKHGILAKEVLLANEDENCLNELYEKMREHFKPKNPMEEFFIDDIVSGIWRIRRLLIYDRTNSQMFSLASIDSQTEILGRYEKSIKNSIYRAYQELKHLN